MSMLYPVALEKGSNDEAYGVIIPDIQGCFSAGDSFEEALSNAKEAIADHLEILAEDGKNIPLASEVSTFLNEEKFKGLIWAVVDVDVGDYLDKVRKIIQVKKCSPE